MVWHTCGPGSVYFFLSRALPVATVTMEPFSCASRRCLEAPLGVAIPPLPQLDAVAIEPWPIAVAVIGKSLASRWQVSSGRRLAPMRELRAHHGGARGPQSRSKSGGTSPFQPPRRTRLAYAGAYARQKQCTRNAYATLRPPPTANAVPSCTNP